MTSSKTEDVKNKEENPKDVELSNKKDNNVDAKKVNIIKVKYALNKVKNLEVAKTNANRPIKLTRLVTDDQNLRFEMNSGGGEGWWCTRGSFCIVYLSD